jgi:hypothetical protein
MILMVQLNIRKLVEEQQLPDLNIICEKLAFEGVTRFEDRYRLPVSISVNCTAYAAKLLAEVAFNPKVLLPLSHIGEQDEFRVQDASSFCALDERLSYWELLARVQTANQVLCGYFVIPDTMDRALEVTINPIGNRTRSELRAWNDGHQRLKLVTLSKKEQPAEAPPVRPPRRRRAAAKRKRVSELVSTLRL